MTVNRVSRGRSALVAGLATLVGCSVALGQSSDQSSPGVLKELVPIPIVTDGVPTVRSIITPRRAPQKPDVQLGTCPDERITFSSADFTGGEFVLQAGFVETEIAAVSYTLNPSDFPVKFVGAEMILAAESLTQETTTNYSWLIWEGTPDNGTLLEVYSSDGVILQPVIMPPSGSPQGVNVNVVVDPGDPDQVFINDNGSATFTIGFRIDSHNNPPTSNCNVGLTPAFCCPPPTNSNAFPTTDTPVLNIASANWLFCRSGCGIGACPPGWHRFSDLGLLTPSGDWNIAATIQRFDCDPNAGACCLPNDTCTILNAAACANANGSFQGAGTACSVQICEDPLGSCCLPDDTCADGAPEIDCVALDGVWQGPGTSCTTTDCDPAGACCIPASGGCLPLTESDCATVVQGIWQGGGTDCASIVCFPMGACCLPDGTCDDGDGLLMSPEDCNGLGGVFQGDGVTCGSVTCPEPTGACCLAGGCLVLSEANCTIAAGTWTSGGTVCADDDTNGTADACETTSCPADLSGDGLVGFADLTQLLNAWGGPCGGCSEDLTGDDLVGFADLTQLLNAWGPC